jgi:transposase
LNHSIFEIPSHGSACQTDLEAVDDVEFERGNESGQASAAVAGGEGRNLRVLTGQATQREAADVAGTRVVNQLHAVFRDLIPGGAPTALTATLAARMLTTVRPASPVEQARKQIARDLVAEIRALDARLTELAKRMRVTLAEHGSRLPEVAGIGPVVAARIVGRVGDAARFPTAAAFASYAGVAPIEVATGNQSRHRLSRSGDRQLNCALHIVAVTQVRMPASKARAYYDTKRAVGKTHNEAMRCLKRRLSDLVWRVMIADKRRRATQTGPGGHQGAALESSAADATPTASSSDKSY